MKIINSGTEKQNTWANDIIRKPVEKVQANIDRAERYAAMGCEGEDIVCAPLHAAIEKYEKRLDEFADTLTAQFVIEWKDQFNRMMVGFVASAFAEAGLKCDNPSQYTV